MTADFSASPFPELAGLRIIPLEHLLLHEAHDPRRLKRLRERLISEDAQTNPVIASAAGDDGFLVLDGAHRMHALREAGCRLALAQLVALPEEAEGWQHLLRAPGAPGEMEGVVLHEASKVSDGTVAEVEANGERLLASSLQSDLASRIDALWGLRALYAEGVPVSRFGAGEVVSPSGDEVAVRYRGISSAEILAAVSAGTVLPAGVTRFRVPRRILGVRFPLSLLKENDAARAEGELEVLVSARLRENRLRRYDEPVLIFE